MKFPGATPSRSGSVEPDATLVRLFDRGGPQYRSYPTSNHFSSSFGQEDYKTAVARSNTGFRPLALNIQLPSCTDTDSCPRHPEVLLTGQAHAAECVRLMNDEIALQGALFSDDPRIVGMCWRAAAHHAETFGRLFQRIGKCFELSPAVACSINLAPTAAGALGMQELRRFGFSCVELDVQASNPFGRGSIGYKENLEQALECVIAARQADFPSIHLGLVYGLPSQTLRTFDGELSQALVANPNRIALSDFAHLPVAHGIRQKSGDLDPPTAQIRLALLKLATEMILAAGYLQVGMDHFVLPTDPVAIAQRHGLLRWDLQGYSASAECNYIGIGLSAIGSVDATYSRNCGDLSTYRQHLDRGDLPVARGMRLTYDDLVRRAVIRSLICHLAVPVHTIETIYLVKFDRYFSSEMERLAKYEAMGFVESEDGWLRITSRGRVLLRRICAIFDRYSQ